eukprot:1218843-Pyramimonas_sp.AAC.1
MAFWYDPGSSGRSSQVDTWRGNPENNVLACSRVFKRLCSNEAIPSMEMNCRKASKQDLGSRSPLLYGPLLLGEF